MSKVSGVLPGAIMRNLSAIQNSVSENSISSSKRPMALGLYWSCAGSESKKVLKIS